MLYSDCLFYKLALLMSALSEGYEHKGAYRVGKCFANFTLRPKPQQ